MAPRKPKQPPSSIPPPFLKAPPSLEPFTAQLDPAKVYISHLDRHKPDYKKQIFTFALVVNASVAGLLLWRLYVAVPTYLSLIQTILGYTSQATVDTESTTRKEQIWILLRRTLMMACDYALIYFIVPWPLTFFFERPANPCTWRWNVVFQAKEVVVRVSRNWGQADLMQGDKSGEESAFWKTRVLPAISTRVLEKTGYLMMDGSWDLDFGVMQDAHVLVDQGKVGMGELDSLVLVHMEVEGWVVYRFAEKEGDSGGPAGEEERRKKMMAFKTYLTKLGKESLFWKWQGIVEEERDADGGFTPDAQRRIQKRVDEEFRKAGVDFKAAMDEVGEVEALPVKG